MAMNPPHPGLSVRHDCIEPLGLTITEAAEALSVTRQTVNNLVNGKSVNSADLAIRLDKAFGGGAETWLRLQMAYDLALQWVFEGVTEILPVYEEIADGCEIIWSEYTKKLKNIRKCVRAKGEFHQ